MEIEVIHVKNMVCERCIRVVRQEMEQLGLEVSKITLGEVEIRKNGAELDHRKIGQVLSKIGFELLDDRKSQLIEKIKTAVIEIIHHKEAFLIHVNFSYHLQEKLGVDYHYLSTLFSSIEGTTLEKYIIRQRIEKAKELLFYNEKSLSQIADDLGYSSVAHLSAQFKKITGMTPSAFKKLSGETRQSLDNV